MIIARMFVREEAVKFGLFFALWVVVISTILDDDAAWWRGVTVGLATLLPAIASLCSMRDQRNYERRAQEHDEVTHAEAVNREPE